MRKRNYYTLGVFKISVLRVRQRWHVPLPRLVYNIVRLNFWKCENYTHSPTAYLEQQNIVDIEMSMYHQCALWSPPESYITQVFKNYQTSLEQNVFICQQVCGLSDCFEPCITAVNWRFLRAHVHVLCTCPYLSTHDGITTSFTLLHICTCSLTDNIISQIMTFIFCDLSKLPICSYQFC